MTSTSPAGTWHKSACILCSINCGVEMKVDGRRIARVRGDKSHPASAGYTCEKALRLDHYQNGKDRLTAPLRRRDDGTFEEIGWDIAISEVAARLADVRDTHGGASIFYYGGGGQANHLGGAYGRATRAAVGSRFQSNALAQEKTGEFWVDGQLFGRPRCHTAGDYENAEVAMFVGKNPWQSHGFPRTRVILKEIARDPARALIVIDPRRSETADLADYHLQVRPGTDAYCLSALLRSLEAASSVTGGAVVPADDVVVTSATGAVVTVVVVDVAASTALARSTGGGASERSTNHHPANAAAAISATAVPAMRMRLRMRVMVALPGELLVTAT